MATFTFDSRPTDIIDPNDGATPDGNAADDVPMKLFRGGIETSVFGYLDGAVMNLGRASDPTIDDSQGIPDGNSLTGDIFLLMPYADPPNSAQYRPTVIWDEQTQDNYGVGLGNGSNGWYDLFSGAARYGLPNANQTVAYEIIQGSTDDDFIKLDYNAANGGVAYTWDITIYGGDGRDLIVSGEGNDQIYGGTEFSQNLGDGIWGQGGNDTIYGGANLQFDSNDDLFGGSGNDTIYGSDPDNDQLWGDENADTLFGGTGGDTLYGGDGADTMVGGAGSDQLYGGNSDDPFSASINRQDNDGNDWVSYAGSAAGVNVSLQDNFIGNFAAFGGDAGGDTFGQVENIVGSGLNDNLIGTGTIVGADATGRVRFLENTIMGGQGSDTIDGLDGNDVLFGDDNLAATPTGGNDTLTGGLGNDLFYGGLGSDTMFGGAGNDTVVGGRLIGPGGDAANSGDVINGGAGNDTIYGDGGNDTVNNDSGNDTLYGGNDTDTITGSSDAETLYGGFGDDNLTAGSSLSGQDSIFGDEGNDTINYSPDVFVIAPTASVTAWDGKSASNFSIVFNGQGKNFSDARYDGGINTDTLVMSSNADLMVADNGDILFGGSPQAGGNNRITAMEVILAGAGADIVVLNDSNTGAPLSGVAYTTGVTVVGGDGTDTVVSGTGADLLIGGNLLTGAGNTEADVLYGGAGGDLLWGDDQGDTAGATGGNDTLYGGSGLDTFYGSGGNDTIIDGLIGTDVDVMYGGAGNDILTDSASANAFGGDGADQLTLTHANSAGSFVFSGGNNAVGDGNDRVIVTGSYNLSSGGLGLGNDVYISNALGTGNLSDSVDGQDGNDAIATYAGADTISGGIGEDVLWGGAGADVLFGGAGTDFLYPQGDNDTIYGGTGFDFVYFGRNDGADAYWDENRINNNTAVARENWIVVYGAFDQAEGGGSPDFLLNGAGVRETDHDLSDAINNGTGDMVRVTNIGGNVWQLNVRDTAAGLGQSTLTFDSRDVAGIGLWDNDALDGHVIQVYLWNGSNYVYSYST